MSSINISFSTWYNYMADDLLDNGSTTKTGGGGHIIKINVSKFGKPQAKERHK